MGQKSLSKSILLILWLASACTQGPLADTTSPTIQKITTSSKVLAKSDCIFTSLTITAQVKDNIRIDQVTLWYRVGEDQKFTSSEMSHADQDQYTGTIIALEIPGGEYGFLEFYLVAQDEAGNEAKSPVDKSVQLLPCVAS